MYSHELAGFTSEREDTVLGNVSLLGWSELITLELSGAVAIFGSLVLVEYVTEIMFTLCTICKNALKI